jgi:hypothetical protein
MQNMHYITLIICNVLLSVFCYCFFVLLLFFRFVIITIIITINDGLMIDD